jgi:hypothetical protein
MAPPVVGLDPSSIGRALLAVLQAAAFASLLTGAYAGMIYLSRQKGARRAVQRPSAPPVSPAPRRRSRGQQKASQEDRRRAALARLNRESLALSDELWRAEQDLDRAVAQRRHWGQAIERIRGRGEEPSTRTTFNYDQRTRDVLALAARVHDLKAARDDLTQRYRSITKEQS